MVYIHTTRHSARWIHLPGIQCNNGYPILFHHPVQQSASLRRYVSLLHPSWDRSKHRNCCRCSHRESHNGHNDILPVHHRNSDIHREQDPLLTGNKDNYRVSQQPVPVTDLPHHTPGRWSDHRNTPSANSTPDLMYDCIAYHP